MKKIILLFIGIAIITLPNHTQTITDIDGNIYHTVTIGTQVWMIENLQTTKYNDNISVPGSFTYNNTTNADTINTYGRLYNWHTVKPGKLCPTGWHVPADAEWTTLANYCGGISVAGGKLKETGTTHWISPNTGATNESGFTALPGGYRFVDGKFYSVGSIGDWWSSTEDPAHTGVAAWSWTLLNSGSNISRLSYGMNNCLSVRCMKDNNTSSKGFTNESVLEFYPNPAKEKLFIKNITSSNSFVYICNLNGELILYKQNDLSPIDISNLENGIYIIKIFDSGKIRIGKFIKE